MTHLTFALRKQAETKKREQRDRRLRIPYEYATVLEQRPDGYVVSQRLLPYEKHEIVEAILFSIANAKSQAEADILSDALSTLAYYQEIGDLDTLMPPDPQLFDLTTSPGLVQYQAAFSMFSDESTVAQARARADLALYQRSRSRALAVNEYLWSPLKRWWKTMTDKSPVKMGLPEWIDFPN